MYELKDISVVIPSYNNLEYLKLIYNSIRNVTNEVELIIFSDGSDDGTKEWLLSLKDKNIIIHILQDRIGHTILYDRGFKEATGKIIGILHADMVIGYNFFENILKHLKMGNIVCGTCIEPPLHPPGGEKIIEDFGMYPEDFKKDSFDNFVYEVRYQSEDKTTNGIFAPWFLLKDEYFDKIGGHDPIYAPYGYEDSDLFTRMALAGFNFIQSRDALVYHFTQRGHKWTRGVGIENDGYREQMEKTRRIYVKKFGTDPIFDYNHTPTPAPKYNIGFNLINKTEQIYNILYPYCSNISIDNNVELTNDIIVEFDCNKLNNQNINFLLQLPLIIKESGEIGEMEYDIFKIKIKSLKEYQSDLIKLK